MEREANESKLEIVTPGSGEDDFLARRSARARRAPKTSCTRCGKCCAGGAPVLLKEDLSLLASGIVPHEAVYAVREGELIKSSPDGDYYEATMELVKVRGKEGSPVCAFFQPEAGCAIYDTRPVQCREFECWNINPPVVGLEDRALARKDLFGTVKALMDVMGRHSEKCSYAKLADAAGRAEQGEEAAVEEILDMLSYDTYLRPLLQEQLNVPPDAMDLVLGRPLIDTIEAFGLKVEKDGETHTLTRSDKRPGSGSGPEAP